MSTWEAGARVGDHILRQRIGSGGMGEVWLAEQAGTGARRALKLISETIEPELLLRFQREGEALARADHPHVVRVHASGSQAGHPWLVLELAEGGDLTARLAGGPLAPEVAARVVREVALGLEHAHARGVLHRDLKPSNVLFDAAGRAKLSDFGLARLVGASRLTRSSDMLGTPAYMAPESALGSAVDARTDVYGLGALLHHALTGTPPFSGKSAVDLLDRVINEPARPPSESVATVPAALDALVRTCLAKDPAQRPASARDVADALERFLQTEPAAREVSPLLLVALAACSLGLLAGVGLLVAGPDPAPPAPAAIATGAAPSTRPTPPVPDQPAPRSWEQRIAEERDQLPRQADMERIARLAGRLDDVGDRLQDPAQRARALSELRGWVAEGVPRAQRYLADELLRGRATPSGKAPAEVEAAELLWASARGDNGLLQSGALLVRLLRVGEGALAPEPRAADLLLDWVGERDPDAQDPGLGLRFLERGGPGDLAAGLGRLRLWLDDMRGGERLAEYRAVEEMELTRLIGVREGWTRAEPGELEAAERRLEQLARARPISPAVARWVATAALLDDPLARALVGSLPHPLQVDPRDLACFDDGPHVTRASMAQAARLSDLHQGIQGDEATARSRGQLLARLERVAGEGLNESQWLLGLWLQEGVGGVAKDERAGALWLVRAALDKQVDELRSTGYDRAKLRIGRSFFLGEPGFPRDPRLGVRWIQAGLALMARKDDRLLEKVDGAMWLGLAAHLGEGLPQQRERGLADALAACGKLDAGWHLDDLDRLAREGNPRAAYLRARSGKDLPDARKEALLRLAADAGVR